MEKRLRSALPTDVCRDSERIRLKNYIYQARDFV